MCVAKPTPTPEFDRPAALTRISKIPENIAVLLHESAQFFWGMHCLHLLGDQCKACRGCPGLRKDVVQPTADALAVGAAIFVPLLLWGEKG